MSDADATHVTPDGHADSGHDDGHGHDEHPEPPGPIDVEGWAYAIGGGLIGLLVALALLVAGGA
jgi:hypothetical protein